MVGPWKLLPFAKIDSGHLEFWAGMTRSGGVFERHPKFFDLGAIRNSGEDAARTTGPTTVDMWARSTCPRNGITSLTARRHCAQNVRVGPLQMFEPVDQYFRPNTHT